MTDHITIKIPAELVEEMDRLDKKHGFRGRGEIAKQAIREFLDKYKSELETPLPRFEWINTDPNGVKILDRQIREVVQIFIKPKGINCSHDEGTDCEHIQFALSLPQVQEIVQKRRSEGWKI